MSTSLPRRTYLRQLLALPGPGATSAVESWAIGNEADKPLVRLYAERTQLSRSVPPTTPTSSNMCAAKTMLWSEILRTFTTAPAPGRTPSTPGDASSPGGRCRTAESKTVVGEPKAWSVVTPQSPPSAGRSGRAFRPSSRRLGKHRPATRHAPRSPAGPVRGRGDGLEQALASREEFLGQHPEVSNRLARARPGHRSASKKTSAGAAGNY